GPAVASGEGERTATIDRQSTRPNDCPRHASAAYCAANAAVSRSSANPPRLTKNSAHAVVGIRKPAANAASGRHPDRVTPTTTGAAAAMAIVGFSSAAAPAQAPVASHQPPLCADPAGPPAALPLPT